MSITINFNSETIVSSYELGFIGEHNATQLDITVPTKLSGDERTDSYRVAFFTNGKTYLSESFTTTTFSIKLWQQLTMSPRMSLQVNAYAEDGSFIGKSQKLGNFIFKPSIDDTEVTESITEAQDIQNEIAANTAARHTHSNKAFLDSFTGAFSELTDTPTTLAGYGITNAYTKTEVDDMIQTEIQSSSANVSAYTPNELYNAISKNYGGRVFTYNGYVLSFLTASPTTGTKTSIQFSYVYTPAYGYPTVEILTVNSSKTISVAESTSQLLKATDKTNYDTVTSKIDNPETKSSGQVLTYDGTDWVAADGGSAQVVELKSSTTYQSYGYYCNYTLAELQTLYNEGKSVFVWDNHPVTAIVFTSTTFQIFHEEAVNNQPVIRQQFFNSSGRPTTSELKSANNYFSGDYADLTSKPTIPDDAEDIAYSSNKTVKDKLDDLDDAINGKADNNQDIQGTTQTVNAWISQLSSQKADQTTVDGKEAKGKATVSGTQYNLGRHALTITDGSTTTSYNFLTAEVGS